MMKKLFVLALSALMLCASLAGCSAASAGEGEGAKIRIGIIQPMEHLPDPNPAGHTRPL